MAVKRKFEGSKLQKDLEKGDPRVKKSREKFEKVFGETTLVPVDKRMSIKKSEPAPSREVGEDIIHSPEVQRATGGSGGISTNIGLGGVSGGATEQATRLLTDPKAEVEKIVTGTAVGAAAGLVGAAIFDKIGTTTVLTGTTGTTGMLITGQVTAGATGYATNAATLSLTTKILAIAGFATWAISKVADIVGTYPFADFEVAESTDKLGYAIGALNAAGEFEKADELIAFQTELVNEHAMGNLISKIPYKNIQDAARINIANAGKSAEAYKYLNDREREKLELGETDEDMWAKIRADQETDRIRIRDETQVYYDQISKNQAKAKSDQRKEDEAYWAKIFAGQEERKRKEREANEKYWEDIRKTWQKQKDEMAKSNLKFGLL